MDGRSKDLFIYLFIIINFQSPSSLRSFGTGKKLEPELLQRATVISFKGQQKFIAMKPGLMETSRLRATKTESTLEICTCHLQVKPIVWD